MTTLHGYQMLTQIYESNNSLVFRGCSEVDQKPLILKILKQDCPSQASLIRYKQEYDITHNLNLEGVIRVYSLQKYQNTLAMLLEDFGGESLKILMNTRKFTLEEFLKIAISVTKILGEIHQKNIIHKDITPSNIVLNTHTGQVKFIDFGISTVLSRENPTIKNPNVLEGTLAYMSPEQTGRMNRAMDYRTDFYSLGVTFYELLTYQLPFDATDAMELVHCHIAKQPKLPHEINAEIPSAISNIIMKLLKKTAEERYQSAWGIKADLEECLSQLQKNGQICEFPLGHQDISDKFQIPQKLYGREKEIEVLLTAFERVSQGTTEMMLVSGYSGIGKSALVQEVYKPITRQRGYFISGKFDQFQRNIPYSAIVSAFQSLVRQLLTESEAQLESWKEKLLGILGSNGQIIIDVVPEVELIIGKQPEVQNLGPAESQNRFNLVFQNFIRVFCSAEHPLVIFLDDLQWADAATLKLLEVMMTDEETRYLFLLGAYRDNEVDPTHPLMMTISSLRNKSAIINDIILTPLELQHISDLISETLHSNLSTVTSLAELIVRKTQGNPFFVNQFLKTLYQENLLTFHPPSSGGPALWHWDIANIEAMGITDNVVELMIRKLKKLPDATQQVIQLAACVGNMFDLKTLSIIYEKSQAETFKDILPAIQEGLIIPLSELEITSEEIIHSPLVIYTYKFLHDRVQQSGYALIDEKLQKAVHLQIGRLLLANLSLDQKGERIFELVDHLNLSQDLISEVEEKIELATLNLTAAQKAKDATAYAAAREYLVVGLAILPGNIWKDYYQLAFTLHRELADVEYLNGNFERSEALIELAFTQAKSAIEKSEVYNTLIIQYTLQTKYEEAIRAGIKALRLLGIDVPEAELPTAVNRELTEAKANLANKAIPLLIDEEKMKDPAMKVAVKLLGNMGPLTFFSSQELWKWTVIKAINLSLQHGFIAGGSYCYSCYGIILNSILGDSQSAYEFGLLSLKLSENSNNLSQNCQDSVIFANYLNCWVKPIKSTIGINNEGYKVGLQSGNLQWTGYNRMFQTITLFFQGVNLERMLEEIPNFLFFCHKTKNQWSTDIILANKLAILSLIGESNELDEAENLETFRQHKSMAAICEFYVLKAQVFYLYEKTEEALKWAVSASEIIDYLMGHISSCHHNFYHSLILTALYPSASEAQQQEYWQNLTNNQKQMKEWADNCPENFWHKYLLVAAEMARLSGQDSEAMELYDQAIESARENDFIQNEALANELAAKFWLGKGKDKFAQVYMTNAYYGYQLWGAVGKVKDLESKYAPLLTKSQGKLLLKDTLNSGLTIKATNPALTSTTSASTVLDLAAVMKAAQAISGEIVLEDLLSKLMNIVLENAGAQTGFLILNREGKLRIEAGKSVNEQVRSQQSILIEESHEVPVSIINYVARTQQHIVSNNLGAETTFTSDPYIQSQNPKSVLCAPIVNQGKLIGILYLENNLTTSAFTSDRIEILSILCSQAAISLENALLYHNVEKANQQLEDYSRTLEAKVAERTRELKEKNEELEQTLQQLKDAQQQMIAQEKLASLGSLTAGIAHEIKNPLNFVNNFAAISGDLAQELDEEIANHSESLAPESVMYLQGIIADIRENVAEINRQGQRANNIVQSMLMHARSEGGQRQLTDINAILAEAVKLVYHDKRAKDSSFNITLEAEYDPSIAPIEAIPQDISRAFINIISNACYAMADKQKKMGKNFSPVLTIKTCNKEDSIEIFIRDNGQGVPAQVKDKIFQPFFTTKPTGEGTGLGLSLTHDIIVGQHKGTIKLESEPSLFTEFTMMLPKFF